jgi:hypothetical protein
MTVADSLRPEKLQLSPRTRHSMSGSHNTLLSMVVHTNGVLRRKRARRPTPNEAESEVLKNEEDQNQI